MREEDIDQLIASWDERLRRVDENLIALEGEPTYQMLAGGARAGLVGETKARVGPALDALGELFDHRERLNTVVARAKELRQDLGFWNRDERIVEITALLGGPSITLGTRQMPVAQRNLLDPAVKEVSIVPEQLLEEMVRAYQLARDAVAVVGAAWGKLEPRLLELEREVGEVRGRALAVGDEEATRADLDRIEAELARIRALVATDPLAVAGALDTDLGPRLRDLRAKVDALLGHKTSATKRLGEVDAVLADIDQGERDALHAVTRAAREIAGFDVDASARAGRQEIARGLAPWHEKIAGAARAGHWKAADVGVTRWMEVARGVLAGQRETIRAANAAVEARTELTGRLSARRAQATAIAARGVLVPFELEQLARDAEATLRERPTDMRKAAQEIEGYEAGVRRLTSTP